MLPDGEGKKLVVTLCARCHTLQSTVTKRKTPDQWRATVDDMIGRGAQIFLEEADLITEYLAKNLGPDNSAPAGAAPVSGASADLPSLELNSASEDELVRALKLEPKLAHEIIAYREKHGGFDTLEDVKKVPGVDAKLIEKIAPQVKFKKKS